MAVSTRTQRTPLQNWTRDVPSTHTCSDADRCLAGSELVHEDSGMLLST